MRASLNTAEEIASTFPHPDTHRSLSLIYIFSRALPSKIVYHLFVVFTIFVSVRM